MWNPTVRLLINRFLSYYLKGFLLQCGGGWSDFFLAESQSRLYPHMRAKFGRDPTAVSKKVPFNFINRRVSK